MNQLLVVIVNKYQSGLGKDYRKTAEIKATVTCGTTCTLLLPKPTTNTTMTTTTTTTFHSKMTHMYTIIAQNKIGKRAKA